MEIQSRPELAFDEQQHLYTLGGLVLPSVTQIMSPMSSMLYAGRSAGGVGCGGRQRNEGA